MTNNTNSTVPEQPVEEVSMSLFAGVLLLVGLLWFWQLGYRDLINPDEGRYAEIPREMVATGDWITPRLQTFKYFEKPPLQYWATAVAFTLFGESNFTARIWPALTGFLTLLWLAYIGARLYGRRTGFYASLIFGSYLIVMGTGHFLTLDMSLAAFMMGGVGALLLAQSAREDRKTARNWMLLAWAMLALALLTKGLVALVLPAGAVVFYSLWQRDWQLWRHLHLFKGLLLVLLVSAPWFVLVSLRNPEFFEFFFIREHFGRFTAEIESHVEPFYYFVPVLLLASLPWTVSTVLALVKPAAPPMTGRGQFSADRFLWVYAWTVFVFFSISGAKIPPYILPMFPALALLAAHAAQRPGVVRWDLWLLPVLGAGFIGASFQLDVFANELRTSEMLATAKPWLTAGGLALLLAFALIRLTRLSASGRVIVASLAGMFAWQSVLWGFNAVSPLRSNRVDVEILAPYVAQGAEVFSVRDYFYAGAFYLGTPVTIVQYRGELKFGMNLEAEGVISSRRQFETRWRQADNALALIERDSKYWRWFQQSGQPGIVVFEGPKRIIVARTEKMREALL